MILLDTHVLIWLDEGSSRLGKKSRKAIDDALREDRLVVSAISFWEVAMLVQKGRLQLERDLMSWRNELLQRGLGEVPISGMIGIQAASLAGFHGDPADRFIVSTALVTHATLVTGDERILKWRGLRRRTSALT